MVDVAGVEVPLEASEDRKHRDVGVRVARSRLDPLADGVEEHALAALSSGRLTGEYASHWTRRTRVGSWAPKSVASSGVTPPRSM